MNELKAIHAYTFDEVEVISTHSNGNDYYLKSEVDNVIAVKDKEIVELKGQVNGFKNRSNLWYFNAVEEHKKLVQATMVIAKNDAKIKRLEKCEKWMKDHFFCEEIASFKVRHQKYKRCLAMSKLCLSEWADAIFIPDKCMGEKHAERYMRWEKRWLKLAEKFKEAKCR